MIGDVRRAWQNGWLAILALAGLAVGADALIGRWLLGGLDPLLKTGPAAAVDMPDGVGGWIGAVLTLLIAAALLVELAPVVDRALGLRGAARRRRLAHVALTQLVVGAGILAALELGAVIAALASSLEVSLQMALLILPAAFVGLLRSAAAPLASPVQRQGWGTASRAPMARRPCGPSTWSSTPDETRSPTPIPRTGRLQ